MITDAVSRGQGHWINIRNWQQNGWKAAKYILNKQIAVEKVDTKYQRADIMTKALPKDSFQFLRKTITGW